MLIVCYCRPLVKFVSIFAAGDTGVALFEGFGDVPVEVVEKGGRKSAEQGLGICISVEAGIPLSRKCS